MTANYFKFSRSTSGSCSKGFSAIELTVVLGLVGLMGLIAAANLKSVRSPVLEGANQTMGFFKQVRAKALSTTSAYFVSAESNNRFVTGVGVNCDDTSPTPDPALSLDLPLGVTTSETTWAVCFSPRGFPDTTTTIPLADTEGGTKIVELFLGGAVRIE